MLEILLLVSSLSCDSAAQAEGTCNYSGSLGDDGATLDGSVGGDGDVDVEGGGDGPEIHCAHYDRNGVCDFEFSIIPPPADPTVTLADIAHFTPSLGATTSQPAGWAVVGLPANLVSPVQQHTVSGTLLGQAAEVRFTPVEWRWDYGDGSTATTDSGGARWESLGTSEFAPTSTSHVYSTRGIYTVEVRVDLTAEYRVGGGAWNRIGGVLSLDTPPTQIRAVTATTMLVAEDCIQNPRGRGC